MVARTPVITHFSDAVQAALGLHQLYGRFTAAALIDDDDGTILDMRPFSGDDACVVCSIEWAARIATDWHRAHGVVLLSSSQASLDECREDDVRMYQSLHDALAQHDLQLIDWIQTNGDDIRSLTFTCDVTPSWDDLAEPA
jgi:hypothetical protein